MIGREVMHKTAARLAVAVLVIAPLALLARDEPAAAIHITAVFDRAGLNVRPGDEVRVRGIPVGRITSIEIDRSDFSATYALEVDPDIAIAVDTTARLVPKTLFGDKYVELQPALPGEERLADGSHLDRTRTQAPTELQSVLDRLEPTLEALDPVALSATLSSLATAFDEAAPDIRRLLDESPAVADAIIASQGELTTLLSAMPGVAGALEDNASSLVSAADQFAQLADLVAQNQPELAEFLSGTSNLSLQAASLLDAQHGAIDGVLAQGTDVLGILSRYPGAITALLDGAPRFVNGLAAATSTGAFRAPIANFAVLNPGSLFDAPGSLGEAQGGSGLGPDVVVEGVDAPEVGVGPDSTPAGTSSVPSLTALLANVLGVAG